MPKCLTEKKKNDLPKCISCCSDKSCKKVMKLFNDEKGDCKKRCIKTCTTYDDSIKFAWEAKPGCEVDAPTECDQNSKKKSNDCENLCVGCRLGTENSKFYKKIIPDDLGVEFTSKELLNFYRREKKRINKNSIKKTVKKKSKPLPICEQIKIKKEKATKDQKEYREKMKILKKTDKNKYRYLSKTKEKELWFRDLGRAEKAWIANKCDEKAKSTAKPSATPTATQCNGRLVY